MASSEPNRRRTRFFIGDAAGAFHILSFSQVGDGSIYVSAPDFSDSKIFRLAGDSDTIAYDVPAGGKISFHGTGISHVRHDAGSEVELRISGSMLANHFERKLGLRHLFTIAPRQPQHAGNSVVFARESDYLLKRARLVPHVFAFFAIPMPIARRVKGMFDEPEAQWSQWGGFWLLSHSIVWLCYRTTSMLEWPQNSLFCFHDGIRVPLLNPLSNGEGRAELRLPTYGVEGSRLSIRI